MESEQHMSEKTPEQAAYEAHATAPEGVYPDAVFETWGDLPDFSRTAWEASAQAAIDAAISRSAVIAAGQPAYEAYCDASNGKSLVSGQPLPAWEDQADEIRRAWERAAYAAAGKAVEAFWAADADRDALREQLAAAVNPTAEDYDNAAEILRLRDQLAGVRERLESLAAGLERQSSRSARVTETKRNIARAVRDIAGQIGRGR